MREAELIYQGMVTTCGQGRRLVIDIGGRALSLLSVMGIKRCSKPVCPLVA